MKTTALTALTVALFASFGHATLAADAVSSRADSSDVVIFERDKGIYGTSPVRTQSKVAVQVDADQILFPHERAIGIDGKVAVYNFGNAGTVASPSFPRR